MRPARLVVAAALVALAVVAGLLASAAGAWDERLSEDDARFLAGERVTWAVDAPLAGAAERLAGLDDDLRARRALALHRRAAAARRRASAAARSARASARRPRPRSPRSRASRRARGRRRRRCCSGRCSFEDTGHPTARRPAERALGAFENALAADPESADAAYDLELLLRLLEARGERPGQNPGAGARRSRTARRRGRHARTGLLMTLLTPLGLLRRARRGRPARAPGTSASGGSGGSARRSGLDAPQSARGSGPRPPSPSRSSSRSPAPSRRSSATTSAASATDAAAMVLVDVSRSMQAAAAPGAPTRLERARDLAVRVRDGLADVPVGLASMTDRTVPLLLPSADAAAFEQTARRALASESPPPREVNTVATTLDAIGDAAGVEPVPPDRPAPRLVVLSPTASRARSPRARSPARSAQRSIDLVTVHVGDADERVFRRRRNRGAALPTRPARGGHAARARRGRRRHGRRGGRPRRRGRRGRSLRSATGRRAPSAASAGSSRSRPGSRCSRSSRSHSRSSRASPAQRACDPFASGSTIARP